MLCCEGRNEKQTEGRDELRFFVGGKVAKLDSRIGALLSPHLRLLKIWTRTWTEGFVFPLLDNEVKLSTKLVSDAARDGRDYGPPAHD